MVTLQGIVSQLEHNLQALQQSLIKEKADLPKVRSIVKLLSH